jgi:hypothetical protein
MLVRGDFGIENLLAGTPIANCDPTAAHGQAGARTGMCESRPTISGDSPDTYNAELSGTGDA